MRRMIFIVLFTISSASIFADGWTGVWHRSGLNDSAELVITVVKPGALHFSLTAFSGAHTGEIEGDAAVIGDTVEWVTIEDDEERKVSFTRTAADVRVTTFNCEGYFGGVGVTFDGRYVSTAIPEEKLAEERMARLFSDTGMVKKMKALLGPSFVYIASCLHLVSDEDVLDGSGAQAISGCVQGICPEMAAIVMLAWTGTLYIGWVDEAGVHYASSDPNFKKRLPKTIAAWVKQYEGATVIFSE